MAKCSTKGCKAGATARIEISQDKANTKTRPVCTKCAEASQVGIVKPNDNIKVNSTS